MGEKEGTKLQQEVADSGKLRIKTWAGADAS